MWGKWEILNSLFFAFFISYIAFLLLIFRVFKSQIVLCNNLVFQFQTAEHNLICDLLHKNIWGLNVCYIKREKRSVRDEKWYKLHMNLGKITISWCLLEKPVFRNPRSLVLSIECFRTIDPANTHPFHGAPNIVSNLDVEKFLPNRVIWMKSISNTYRPKIFCVSKSKDFDLP